MRGAFYKVRKQQFQRLETRLIYMKDDAERCTTTRPSLSSQLISKVKNILLELNDVQHYTVPRIPSPVFRKCSNFTSK